MVCEGLVLRRGARESAVFCNKTYGFKGLLKSARVSNCIADTYDSVFLVCTVIIKLASSSRDFNIPAQESKRNCVLKGQGNAFLSDGADVSIGLQDLTTSSV